MILPMNTHMALLVSSLDHSVINIIPARKLARQHHDWAKRRALRLRVVVSCSTTDHDNTRYSGSTKATRSKTTIPGSRNPTILDPILHCLFGTRGLHIGCIRRCCGRSWGYCRFSFYPAEFETHYATHSRRRRSWGESLVWTRHGNDRERLEEIVSYIHE
jgi:hypothetical protein